MSTSQLLEDMHKKFEINRTKIKGSCQWARKVVIHDSKSDLLLEGRWQAGSEEAENMNFSTRNYQSKGPDGQKGGTQKI